MVRPLGCAFEFTQRPLTPCGLREFFFFRTNHLSNLAMIRSTLVSKPLTAACIRSFSRTSTDLPVITVPKYLEGPVKEQRKAMRRDLGELMERRNQSGDRRIKVIEVPHDPKLNHFFGQTYPKNRRGEPFIQLASLGWRRGFKHQNEEIIFKAYARNKLYIRDYGNKSLDGTSLSTFKELGFDEDLLSILSMHEYHRPSEIQRQAIPSVFTGSTVLICAEAGSGKTMAYLAPVLQMIRRLKEDVSNSPSTASRTSHVHRPFGLIVVPARELAEQISHVAIEFARPLSIGVACMIGGASKPELSHTGYDLIITTAGLLDKHLNNVYSTENLHHLVLDEADTLLDDSFSEDIVNLVSSVGTSINQGLHCQVIFASATMPRGIEKQFRQDIGINNYTTIVTENLHRIPCNVEQRFVRLRTEDKTSELLRIVSKEMELGNPTMIFSNMTKAGNFVYQFLNSNGFPCMRLNSSLPDTERLTVYDNFRRGDYDVISCTDIASRGLDTRHVQHVINFDCPRFSADYLHRAGRVGRLSSGSSVPKVTTFITHRPNIHLLQELEWSVRNDTPIASVDGNIKKLKSQLDIARNTRRLARG